MEAALVALVLWQVVSDIVYRFFVVLRKFMDSNPMPVQWS